MHSYVLNVYIMGENLPNDVKVFYGDATVYTK